MPLRIRKTAKGPVITKIDDQLQKGVTTAGKARRQRERKSERMDIRVTPTIKRFVEHVMDECGLTAGDLLLEGARAVLRDLESQIEVKRLGFGTLKVRRPD